MEKLRHTAEGVRADMSLLESKKEIQETESVTRLTELAFIFIPLTFVSSMFSMQVTELSAGVPLSTFIITASSVTVLLYGLRLLIRSRPFNKAKQSFFDNVRKHNSLSAGSPISLRDFVRYPVSALCWGQGKVWTAYVILVAVGISVAPVAILWRRTSLDTSFKVILTLVFIPCGFVLLFFIIISLVEDEIWHLDRFIMRLFLRSSGQ